MRIGEFYDAIVIPAPGRDPIRERRVIPAPAPNEAIVRMTASSLNFHDVLALRHSMPTLKYPRIPLSDGCGEVIAVGADVKRVAVGDRVVPSNFANWITGPGNAQSKAILLGDQIDGFLTQVAILPAEWLVHAPKNLSDLQAATLSAAGLTAWRAITVEAQIEPGQTVLLQGTGGVSLFALQIAKLKGAVAIITSSSDEKLERVKAMGADHLINYKRNPDWASVVNEITRGQGADLVLDMGGPETFVQSLTAVRHGGTVVPIGVLSGYDVPMSLRLLIMKDIVIRGMSGGNRDDLDGLCRAYEANKAIPVVLEHVGMNDLKKGLAHMERGQHFGKIGVKID